MNRVFGVFLIIMALAIGLIPAFTDCQSQGKALTTSTGKIVPMKCHWTGVAEIGAAVPLFVTGAIVATSKRREYTTLFGSMAVVLGALAIAFPAGLIGVCATPTMLCHTVMKPVLITLGSLTIAVSLVAVALTSRIKAGN